MESVGQRVTRSRAKALGTPLELLPHKTPEPRTTGRRRKAVPQLQEESAQQECKQLHFTDEPAASIPEAALQPEENASIAPADAATEPTPQPPSSNARSAEQEAHQETHDNPSVLMASPIVLAPKDQLVPAPTVEPVPLDLGQHAQAQGSSAPASAPSVASQSEPCPLFAVAPQSPMLTPSPSPAADASPLPSIASPPGFDFLQDGPSPLHDANAAMDANPFLLNAAPVGDGPIPVSGSPLSLAANPQPDATDATGYQAAAPEPIAASPLPIAASPMAISPFPAAQGNHQDGEEPIAAPSPLLGNAIPARLMEGSPLPSNTPVSFTSDAPPRVSVSDAAAAAAGDAATPPPPATASVPATPLSITSSLMVEAMEAAQFSPMPEDDQDADMGDSPISLSGGAALTLHATPLSVQPLQPQAVQAHPQDAMMDDNDADMVDATPFGAPAGGHRIEQQPASTMASPLTFVSDCHVTPVAEPSPVAGAFPEAPDSVPHSAAAAAGMSPAVMGAGVGASPSVSTFQGFAAVIPTPSDAERQPESPSLMPAATLAASPAPLNAATNAPHAADGPNFGMSTPSGDFTTATQPSDHQAPATHATTLVSPLDGTAVLRAPAPTPEYGALPAWTLANTPLVNAIAASIPGTVTVAAAAAATHCFEEGCGGDDNMDAEMDSAACEDVNQVHDAEGAEEPQPEDSDAADQQEVEAPVEDQEEGGAEETERVAYPEEQVAAAPAAATQAAASKTPMGSCAAAGVGVPSRSPLPGFALRGATPKLTAGKVTPGGAKSSTATPGAAKPSGSSYAYVESRYNKTPVAAGTANKARAAGSATNVTTTPVALTNAAAGAKSIKRVSIHTPEGPRSVGPQRQAVVPTPFRPKAALPGAPAPEQQPPAPQPQQQAAPPVTPPVPMDSEQPESSAAAEERRAKAAERLKAIHASEQQSAPTSAPGYLAPTAAFAVKAVKSKVDAGNYDPRSLRQLKREVKEAAARKEAKAPLTEARDTKLTPKLAERQLPMPDDQEGSDDEAQYDEGQENDLVAAMTGLEVAPPKNTGPVALRGLPAPQGKHIRFSDNGKVTESPKRTVLRGLPVATGKYKRFD